MGKVDQGVVVLWMARHLYGGPLSYTGFGGHGRQVRDLLHVDDLYDL
jgi:CDP-paratose 2-epimerase